MGIYCKSFYYIWFSWNVVLIVNGKQIDNMEREIETICLKLLLSQFVGHIKREAKRMVDLVNDTIKLSHLDEMTEISKEEFVLL